MTTRSIANWAVLLSAAVLVVFPVTAREAPRTLGSRTISAGGTVHCGSAVTAARKHTTPALFGARGPGYGELCHQAGKDRLITAGLGGIVGLLAIAAVGHVLGSKEPDDEPEPSDPIPV